MTLVDFSAIMLVGLVLRYAPQIKDLQDIIRAGHLGRIISLEANEHIEPQHGGFFMRDWRRHSAYSGGFMLEKCCHDLDLYHMITGSRPIRVASFGGRKTFTAENAPNRIDMYEQTPSMWQTAANPFLSDGDIVTLIRGASVGADKTIIKSRSTPRMSGA